MLTLLAKHCGLRPVGRAHGDLHVDQHHTVEDVGICLGQALRQALGDKAGIRRYGHFTLPMEETLVTSALDLSGRLFFVFQVAVPAPKIGDFDSELVEDFWQAVAANGLCNLHLVVHHGRNSHHLSEAVFKATARRAADGGRARSADDRRAEHQGRAVSDLECGDLSPLFVIGRGSPPVWHWPRQCYGRDERSLPLLSPIAGNTGEASATRPTSRGA